MQKNYTPTSDTPKRSALAQLKEYDARRPGFPGEHWLVLGAGLAVLMASNRSRSWVTRTAGSALGTALVYRAASGSDGLAKVLSYLPISGLGRH